MMDIKRVRRSSRTEQGGKNMAALTFAAIDVGSFEVEMGIYEISNRNKIRKLDQIRHVTALGKDTYNNGKISYEMVEELEVYGKIP